MKRFPSRSLLAGAALAGACLAQSAWAQPAGVEAKADTVLRAMTTAAGIARPLIEGAGGVVVKFEADNCFAMFEGVSPAVQAAIATKFHGAEHKSRIELLVDNIVPALDGLDGTQPPEALLHAAVEANVRRTIRTLLETPEARAKQATSGMKLVGAIYELETGRVRFLD